MWDSIAPLSDSKTFGKNKIYNQDSHDVEKYWMISWICFLSSKVQFIEGIVSALQIEIEESLY